MDNAFSITATHGTGSPLKLAVAIANATGGFAGRIQHLRPVAEVRYYRALRAVTNRAHRPGVDGE